MKKRAESVEELFPLMEACKAGDLESVGQWIEAGKPLDSPAGKRSRRRSPLEIAIEKGFLTLAKTLLKGGADPLANGNALDFAVGCGRVDLARLLLDHGVDIHSVSFRSVCWRESPEMIRLFIDRGADVVTGDPLYEALTSSVRPMLGIFKDYNDRFPDWQRQLDRALLHHVQHEGVKNVALLVWAGARPDAVVTGENEIEETALEAAALKGNLAILKSLKPAQYPAMFNPMLRATWLTNSIPVADYLIGLGAKLNDEKNGGSDLLSTTIRHGLEDSPFLGSRDVEPAFRFIEHLCKLGARWLPDDSGPKGARHALRRIPADRLFRLVTILLQNKAAAPEFIEEIFTTPGMRTRLGAYMEKIVALLHPPEPKKPRSVPAGASSPASRLALPEVRARAHDWLLAVCIEGGPRPFHTATYSSWPAPKLVRSRLGLTKDDDRDPYEILSEACAAVNRQLTTVELHYGSTDGSRRGALDVKLAGKAEWVDVFREVTASLGSQTPYWLSLTGERLLGLVDAGEVGKDGIEERELCAKLCLGEPEDIAKCLEEVEVRTGGLVRYERIEASGDQPRYRIWRESSSAAGTPPQPALNPVCNANFHFLSREDIDSVRSMLQRALLSLNPVGAGAVTIYRVASRHELQRCFPRLAHGDRSSPSTQLVELFANVPLNASLKRTYDFRDEAPAWRFALLPRTTWAEALKSIEDEAKGPTLEQLYGISTDAARLLDWLQHLSVKRLQSGWSPSVEDSNTREIGLQPIGGSDSFPFYLRILSDEINERTPFVLTAFFWSEYSRQKTRLKLTPKPSDLETVVRQIQWLGLKQGRVLDGAVVQAQVTKLLATQPIDG